MVLPPESDEVRALNPEPDSDRATPGLARGTGRTVDPMAARRVAIVPHTHWDREWYHSYQEFRLKLVDTLDTLRRVVRSASCTTHSWSSVVASLRGCPSGPQSPYG